MTIDIYEQAAKQLARDIDTEVLMSLFGWNSLEISQGTVYGSRYQTAKPVWDSNVQMGNNATWDEMIEWCVETFGPTAPIWGEKAPNVNMRWYANNSKFWFKNEADLTLFMLRWS